MSPHTVSFPPMQCGLLLEPLLMLLQRTPLETRSDFVSPGKLPNETLLAVLTLPNQASACMPCLIPWLFGGIVSNNNLKVHPTVAPTSELNLFVFIPSVPCWISMWCMKHVIWQVGLHSIPKALMLER